MSGSLEGVRVVDLTRGVAGPYTSKFLADQGADVLKLEPPSGDPSRAFGPFPNDEPHPERSGLFLHLNRNKRAAVVDPASAEGAERIRFLAAQAHIVLEDYAPGSAEAWGWGWKTLHAANPALVMTSMTPQARLAHVEALDEALSALTRDRDKEQLFHQLQAAGVCATPVRRATDVLEDPQLQTRGFFEALPTADEQRSYLYPGLMFRMARTPNALRSGPARLGEHNREIYCDLLGYTPEELTALEEKGLVGEAFPPEVWRPA